jgi:undecaprenyl diphosphate synthase
MASLHVAIIMDGNGRWAAARGLPRIAGHRAGANAVRRVVEAAPSLGIGTLTVYAFSCDNWKRPREEVSGLMRLLRTYLIKETARCVREGVRLEIIGRRDRLPASLLTLIESAERATAPGRTLVFRIALDYSSRDAILEAASRLRGQVTRDEFSRVLEARDVDLLIRTGGEQRLSDFLLWECAYAELYFTERMWPDFGKADMEAAIREYQCRDRRFGGLSVAAG